MKTRNVYTCEICGDEHDSKHNGDDYAKKSCLACEGKGIPDPSKIDMFVMYQDSWERYSEITFCVAQLEVNRGHYLSSSQWATRDTQAGDNFGDQFCAGSNDSYILAKDNKEFYSDSAVNDFGPHFKRMAKYLVDIGKEAKYWDGENVVIYTGDLDVNDVNDATVVDDEEVDVEDVDNRDKTVQEWVEEGTDNEESIFVGEHWCKVGEPPEGAIVFKRKAIYFTDWVYKKDKQKDEVKQILRKFKHHNIHFQEDVRITQAPPFGYTFGFLFFDYGGVMSSGSDGTVWSHCQQVVNDAKKNPRRDYIITSTFSSFVDYMKEAIEEFGDHGLNNIYFGVDDFLKKTITTLNN